MQVDLRGMLDCMEVGDPEVLQSHAVYNNFIGQTQHIQLGPEMNWQPVQSP